MRKLSFRVVSIQTDVAEAARRKAKAGVTNHQFVTADSPRGYPCRHCLQWARPGESMVLFPFTSIAAGPYSETGPIFIHAEPCQRYAETNQFPSDFRQNRAIRAYNSQHELIAAEVANEEEPEAVIARFLEKPETAFVHVRSASHGCYTMEIQCQ